MNPLANAQMLSHQNLRAARYSVFNTNELLEQILVRLPPRQIIEVQRVCKQWKDCIAGSPEIKQKLFFTKEIPEEVWQTFERTSSLRGHQLGWKALPRGTPVMNLRRYHIGGSVYRPAQLSPFLRLASSTRMFGSSATRLHNVHRPEAAVLGGSRAVLLVDFLTWSLSFGASSFLTDPPCVEARVSCDWRALYSTERMGPKALMEGTTHRLVSNASGLTIADLIRGIMSVRGSSPAYTLRHGKRVRENIAFADLVCELEDEGYEDFHIVGGIELHLFSVAIVEDHQWEQVRSSSSGIVQ